MSYEEAKALGRAEAHAALAAILKAEVALTQRRMTTANARGYSTWADRLKFIRGTAADYAQAMGIDNQQFLTACGL